MKIYDAHQDIAANIQLVSGKDFFKKNEIDEGKIKSEYKCVNQVDYPRLIEGNVNLVFATVFAQSKKQALEQFKIYQDICDSKKIVKILERDGLVNLTGQDIGFLLNMEGTSPLENLDDLDFFYDLGLRSLGISWRGNNQFIDGDNFLKLGIKLLKLVEERKMVLDLAHMNEDLFWRALENYHKPFIVSHTACRAICDNDRNLSDKQIRMVGKEGGLVGIAGVDLLIGGKEIDWVIKNIVHAVEVSSIDNVCLGSDFDGMVNPKLSLVKGFEDVSCFPNLIERLGTFFSYDQIEKIAHKNLREFILKVL